jgi:hypothetical protein
MSKRVKLTARYVREQLPPPQPESLQVAHRSPKVISGQAEQFIDSFIKKGYLHFRLYSSCAVRSENPRASELDIDYIRWRETNDCPRNSLTPGSLT